MKVTDSTNAARSNTKNSHVSPSLSLFEIEIEEVDEFDNMNKTILNENLYSLSLSMNKYISMNKFEKITLFTFFH